MKEEKALELAHQLHHLQELADLANDPKLLWEEMQILGQKAFALQDKMEILLNTLEKETNEVSAIQTLFETREKMWDIMNQLAQTELKIKEKTHKKTETSPKHCKCKKEKSSTCCCHNHAQCDKEQEKCKKK